MVCMYDSHWSGVNKYPVVNKRRVNWDKKNNYLPVSPNSPKMLRKTSASVPLPFRSVVKTDTTYLLSGKNIQGIIL